MNRYLRGDKCDITLAYGLDTHRERPTVIYGVAYCLLKHDTFSKRIGKELANKRLRDPQDMFNSWVQVPNGCTHREIVSLILADIYIDNEYPAYARQDVKYALGESL